MERRPNKIADDKASKGGWTPNQCYPKIKSCKDYGKIDED